MEELERQAKAQLHEKELKAQRILSDQLSSSAAAHEDELETLQNKHGQKVGIQTLMCREFSTLT